MRPNEIVRKINRLELSEKLLLVEDIWDSIAQKNHFLPMPTWQKGEL
jgi:putative addiction module component (TIGR02574 family)